MPDAGRSWVAGASSGVNGEPGWGCCGLAGSLLCPRRPRHPQSGGAGGTEMDAERFDRLAKSVRRGVDRQRVLISRRTLVGSSLAAAAVLRLGTSPVLGARQEGTSDPTTWRTWLLKSVDELRPADPGEPTSSELDELLDYQSRRTD